MRIRLSSDINPRRLWLIWAFIIIIFTPFVLHAKPDASFAYRPDLGSASPALDIYSLSGARDAPVVVFVHGGAWKIGKRSHVQFKPAHFNGEGYVFVSLDYRLVPAVSVSEQLSDIDHALAWLSANISRYGGDPGNLHLLGHSAGAHLVSMTGVVPLSNAQALIRSGALRSVISNDTRAYDLPRIAATSRGGRMPKLYKSVFTNDPAYWKAMSPGLQIKTGQPKPAFLVLYSGQGDDNVRRSFAEDFANRLRKTGGQATVFDGEKYSHREINRLMGKSNDITRAVDVFLRENAR